MVSGNGNNNGHPPGVCGHEVPEAPPVTTLRPTLVCLGKLEVVSMYYQAEDCETVISHRLDGAILEHVVPMAPLDYLRLLEEAAALYDKPDLLNRVSEELLVEEAAAEALELALELQAEELEEDRIDFEDPAQPEDESC